MEICMVEFEKETQGKACRRQYRPVDPHCHSIWSPATQRTVAQSSSPIGVIGSLWSSSTMVPSAHAAEPSSTRRGQCRWRWGAAQKQILPELLQEPAPQEEGKGVEAKVEGDSSAAEAKDVEVQARRQAYSWMPQSEQKAMTPSAWHPLPFACIIRALSESLCICMWHGRGWREGQSGAEGGEQGRG
eukprot:scaffold255619_cov21-Tisochrysis_lutea.AAC.1